MVKILDEPKFPVIDRSPSVARTGGEAVPALPGSVGRGEHGWAARWRRAMQLRLRPPPPPRCPAPCPSADPPLLPSAAYHLLSPG